MCVQISRVVSRCGAAPGLAGGRPVGPLSLSVQKVRDCKNKHFHILYSIIIFNHFNQF